MSAHIKRALPLVSLPAGRDLRGIVELDQGRKNDQRRVAAALEQLWLEKHPRRVRR